MHRYAAARSLLSILSLLGWLVIIVGGFAALRAFGAVGLAGSALIFVSALASGVLLLAVVQMAVAQIDVADNSFQTVTLLEKLLHRTTVAPSSAPGLQASGAGREVLNGQLIKAYRGFGINREPVGVSVDNRSFNNVLAAERWIDESLAPENRDR